MGSNIWQISRIQGSIDRRIGFAVAWKLSAKRNLSSVTNKLPENVTIFSTKISAGQAHLKGVLVQASESSKRGLTLARNSSIDLLMRLTCQSQIKDAMRISGISSIQKIGAFGFALDDEDLGLRIQRVEAVLGRALEREDSLLEMNLAKRKFLRKLHSIPQSFPDSRIADFLLEKSSLLCFSK